MKHLVVVRHAKSSWKDHSLSDSQRPLNKRGNKNAPEMGKRLKSRGILPDQMISSKANRALTTAHYFAKELDFPASNIEVSPMLYHTNEQELLKFVHELSDKMKCVMIFGHNPGFTDFVNYLTGGNIFNLSTSGYAIIEFNQKSWKDIEPKTGNLEEYNYPKKQG